MTFRLLSAAGENFVMAIGRPRARLQPRWHSRYLGDVGREDDAAERGVEPGERPRATRRGRWLSAALVLLSLSGIASLFTGPGGFVRIRNLRSELAVVNDHNFDLLQSAHRLQSQLDRLSSDEGAIERLARRHRLVRDGETLYQFGEDARRRERTAVAKTASR